MQMFKVSVGMMIALAGSAACNEIPSSGGGGGAEALVTEGSTPDVVSGTYRRGGASLRFQSQLDPIQGEMVFTRPDHSELFAVRHRGTEVSMSVLGRLSTSQDTSAASGGAEPRGDSGAFAALVGTPEFALLPALSSALEKAGLTGAAYPAAQPIHDLAAHAARMLHAKDKGTSGAVQMTSQEARHGACPAELCGQDENWDEDSCRCVPLDHPEDRGEGVGCNPSSYPDLRSDPCHDDCRGMCGPGCGGAPFNNECWKFVCGDCGYHSGCAFHDDMCGACYGSYGANVFACSICLTPLAVFVAKVGC
jgi:hypothetical protein